MNEHLERIIDFATDPRAPYNILTANSRSRKYGKPRPADSSQNRLLIALTFDVEREYGSTAPTVKRATERLFLQHVNEHFPLGTIFIQGSLVEENAVRIRSLQNAGFEIGLHGYNHELWGHAQWYLSDKPMSVEEKDSLVRTALHAFDKAGLTKPSAFRAPNLVIDAPTLDILRKNGFTVDSSLPSHKGSLPIPSLRHDANGLVRIPVSVDPAPDLKARLVIPYLRYRVFNLKTLKELTSQEILQSLSRIVTIQREYGFPAHLVINAHSWEFYEPTIPELSYCSETNFTYLRELTNKLAERFGLEYVNMSKLGQIFLEHMPVTGVRQGWKSGNLPQAI
jgi:peptidoglycan/xylan/chitin deacetylase (PgdA/CDA1 family)